MNRLVVLGATGSIGTQTLDVVRENPDRLEVVGLVSHSSSLDKLSQEFPKAKCLQLQRDGMAPILDLVQSDACDTVVVSLAGVIALEPTVAAIVAGKKIALASKEVLVAAGEVVMALVQKHGTLLTPIDSEHSAVFQCVQGANPTDIDQVILTASGGPFRGFSKAQLEQVTREQALNHPTWKMGGKITIDSATLMNKALETVEAKWLFGLKMSQVDAVIHPKSIIHSFVVMKDGSALAQLGWPNMRLPIQYALFYPERVENSFRRWSPLESGDLTFEPIDHEVFPAINLAREADAIGGTMPAVFNAANEKAVSMFLAGDTSFSSITALVSCCMESHQPEPASLESVLSADRWAREYVSHG